MMAEENAKKERLMRRREAAAAAVVPRIDELLANLDKEEEEEEEEGSGTGSGCPGAGQGAVLRAPAGAPRTHRPGEPPVPKLEELLAHIDGHEGAKRDANGTPSLELVLANIDRDEQADASRTAFFMLGSGAEPDPERPTDPLAKMLQLTSAVKPADLIPTRAGEPADPEERKPEVAFKSRPARWKEEERPGAPPPLGHLVGEGLLLRASR